MRKYDSMDIRPYQMLCLICRLGRRKRTEPYHHESRLDEIQSALEANPIVPLTLRCNTGTVFRYQNPGREYDTPEGKTYNDLRDLTLLQRIGAVPGDTLPAIDFLSSIFDAVPTCQGICAYPESEAPGWPRCRFADSGNYERGFAFGIGALVRRRTPEEKRRAKKKSVQACRNAARLRIRPHHLLCLACFHAGRSGRNLAPIEEDNLCECIEIMQAHPEIPVELIHGPCMICPPCSSYDESSNLCIGGKSMGLRDDKKDLDTLRRTGLRYGDILPARELLNRIFGTIVNPAEICGFGDGVERGREWTICSGATDTKPFRLARKIGLGVDGVSASSSPKSRSAARKKSNTSRGR